MFKFACFLLKFAPLWYLRLLISGLHRLEYVSWKDLRRISIVSIVEAVVVLVAIITGIVPSLMFFNNVYYNQFPELRI